MEELYLPIGMITRRDMLKCGAAFIGGAAITPCFAKGKDAGHPALYWHSMGDAVGCELCPNACMLDEGKTGVCRTRRNLDGSLVTDAYANPCTVNDDPIEKKPLFHVLPGSRRFPWRSPGAISAVLIARITRSARSPQRKPKPCSCPLKKWWKKRGAGMHGHSLYVFGAHRVV